MDKIIRILKENHYVTVDYLVQEIRYSPASIRRDLTLLEKQGLVKRSYGGVEIKDDRITPFRFRQHSMKIAKNAIAKQAASLVKNGDTVFLDSSSTTQYMGHFLTKKKGITVITSNMMLASFLFEHGIVTYCTGGRVTEYPGTLGGKWVGSYLSEFNVDIGFFASRGINANGDILVTCENSVMNIESFRQNCKKLAYLCGSDKFNSDAKFKGGTLGNLDYFISDKLIDTMLKEKFDKTVFICTNE